MSDYGSSTGPGCSDAGSSVEDFQPAAAGQRGYDSDEGGRDHRFTHRSHHENLRQEYHEVYQEDHHHPHDNQDVASVASSRSSTSSRSSLPRTRSPSPPPRPETSRAMVRRRRRADADDPGFEVVRRAPYGRDDTPPPPYSVRNYDDSAESYYAPGYGDRDRGGTRYRRRRGRRQQDEGEAIGALVAIGVFMVALLLCFKR